MTLWQRPLMVATAVVAGMMVPDMLSASQVGAWLVELHNYAVVDGLLLLVWALSRFHKNTPQRPRQ